MKVHTTTLNEIKKMNLIPLPKTNNKPKKQQKEDYKTLKGLLTFGHFWRTINP
jgi:hypothetical protein